MKKHKNNSKKAFIILAVLIFGLLVAGFAYTNRSKVRDFLNSDDTTTVTDPTNPLQESKSINEVDYGPSNPTDNDQINEQKKNADANTRPISKDIVATITNTRIANGLAQVSVLVQGTASGTCNLTLTKDAKKIEKASTVVIKAGVTTCEDFNVPLSELSDGAWSAIITVDTVSAKSNTATATLQVGS